MTVQVSKTHKSLIVPTTDAVAKVFGDVAKPLNGSYLALPHTDDVTRILNNIGVKAPAPILYHYDWNNQKPFKIQRATAAMMTTNRRCYVCNEMGTGKTRAALYSFDWMKKNGQANKMLVLAPLSTLNQTWAKEIMGYFPDLSFSVLYGTREKRKLMLEQDADVYIINHDGIKVLSKELQERRDIDVILIDELASFRTPRTERHKALLNLVQNRTYVWGMTGSPTPQAPTDAWAQCRVVTPDTVPKFFKQFREKTMRQVSQFKWLPKEHASQIVYKAMHPHVRYLRDEAMELPPVSYVSRETELSPDQKSAYDEMVKRLRVDYAQGRITAVNQAVQMLKLLQIASGFAYTDEDTTLWLNPTKRLQLVDEVIDQSLSKVLVFVPFIAAVEKVYAHVKKDFDCGMIYGNTPKSQRDEIFTAFQNSDKRMKVIVAHPKTMSHGLTLTAASTIFWYAPNPSLDIYEQANARISRPGQKHKQLIVQAVGCPIEKYLYKRLADKSNVQDALLDLLKT